MQPKTQPASTRRRSIVAVLRQEGLMLESDPRLLSVVSTVSGKPIAGSWWGHPSGRAIYQVVVELSHHPDVTVAKLVSGKTTYVHRVLWPHLLAVASARAGWQTKGLSAPARALLKLVRTAGPVCTDQPKVARLVFPMRPPAVALELEKRLLVFSRQVHTSSGRHAKQLMSWESWGLVAGPLARLTEAKARVELERVVAGLNQRFAGRGRLPWPAAQTTPPTDRR